LNYTIDGIETLIIDPTATDNQGTGFLNIAGVTEDSVSGFSEFSMSIDANDIGTYTPALMIIFLEGPVTTIFLGCDGGMCNVDVELTTFESVGGFIIGTFEGNLDSNQGGGTSFITGEFKVERE